MNENFEMHLLTGQNVPEPYTECAQFNLLPPYYFDNIISNYVQNEITREKVNEGIATASSNNRNIDRHGGPLTRCLARQ